LLHFILSVLGQNTKRESGRKVQSGNINAAKTIADIIRTCLGPKSMMKMLLDPMGGIVMTNDGNAILREIQVQHPAAKSMIEISRTQDEEVGDGTTSVIILAGEMLSVAEHFLEQQMHPTVVISAYRKALDDMISTLKKISTPVDTSNRDVMLNIINSSITTKAISRWASLACSIALDAVRTVQFEENGRKEIDIKKYARVEKIFKKNEKQFSGTTASLFLKLTLQIPLLSQVRCTSRACGARLPQRRGRRRRGTALCRLTSPPALSHTCSPCASARRRASALPHSVVGTFPAALLDGLPDVAVREPSSASALGFMSSICFPKEVERNLQDAMQVCRNVLLDPQLVPGGGASEMAVAHALTEKSKAMTGVEQWPYRAVAQALEVIPRTLIQNCGASTIRLLTSLRAKHTQENCETWGVNGETGTLVDMKELGIWEPLAVKLQTYKTAVETAVLLLRIDDIVSGHKKKGDDQSRQGGAPDAGQE
uniref:Chaperonin containing TCP1 subunit 3 n=1 Tax=Mustela putorius furo TaxID=9669 RepID=M3XZ67_MUSPF